MGLSMDLFWQYTPLEYFLHKKGIQKNRTRELNNILTGSYMTACLNRAKKIPELETILINTEKKKPRKLPSQAALEAKTHAIFRSLK